jgi:hypothetical protein
VRARDSLAFPVAGAALGALAGLALGERLRMTVPHGCRTGCAPDYGIRGPLAGAVWGTLLGWLAGAVRRRSARNMIGLSLVLGFMIVLTIVEMK